MVEIVMDGRLDDSDDSMNWNNEDDNNGLHDSNVQMEHRQQQQCC